MNCAPFFIRIAHRAAFFLSPPAVVEETLRSLPQRLRMRLYRVVTALTLAA